MCGRYHLHTTPAAIREEFDTGQYIIHLDLDSQEKGREIFPTEVALTIQLDHEGRRYPVKRSWQFRPVRIRGAVKRPINARVETLLTKPYWRSAALGQRCLVPATSWDEWQTVNGRKRRFRLRPEDVGHERGPLFALAGVWGDWEWEGQPQSGFAIVVGPAHQRIERLHDRQPIIVQPGDYQKWLDPGTAEPRLEEILEWRPPKYDVREVTC